MARKSGIDVLSRVTLRPYFRSSVGSFGGQPKWGWLRIRPKLTHKPKQRLGSTVSAKVCLSGQQILACISLKTRSLLWASGRAICGQHGEPAGSGAKAEPHWSTAPSINLLFLHGPSWLNPVVGDFRPYPQPTPKWKPEIKVAQRCPRASRLSMPLTLSSPAAFYAALIARDPTYPCPLRRGRPEVDELTNSPGSGCRSMCSKC